MKPVALIMTCGLAAAFACSSSDQASAQSTREQTFDNSTVSSVDLDRYLGTWYEIARFDHSFERNMQGVQANYSKRDDGLIRVINSGYKGGLDGKFKKAEGKARFPDPDVTSKLQVAFFLNFWGDYYVMELAEDYRYALVGSSKQKYLWILSRTPELAAADKEYLTRRISERGYDIAKLIWVEQRAR